jgi:hypothetical protein
VRFRAPLQQYKAEYNALEKQLDILSEDKKVINLLYIDQLNRLRQPNP